MSGENSCFPERAVLQKRTGFATMYHAIIGDCACTHGARSDKMKNFIRKDRILIALAILGLIASLIPVAARVRAEEANKY